MVEYDTMVEEKKEAEIVEKRSKFIANIFYVRNKEEIQEKIQEITKKYRDARHHCYAYRLLEGEKVVERANDDGEPSGTAGMPILSILSNRNLCNVLVIVTRYFGGILLGTGGLVRAYSGAAVKVLEQITIAKEIRGIQIKVELNYSAVQELQYYCRKNEIEIEKIEYLNTVRCILTIKNEKQITIFTNIEENPLSIIKCEILGEKTLRKRKENENLNGKI